MKIYELLKNDVLKDADTNAYIIVRYDGGHLYDSETKTGFDCSRKYIIKTSEVLNSEFKPLDLNKRKLLKEVKNEEN